MKKTLFSRALFFAAAVLLAAAGVTYRAGAAHAMWPFGPSEAEIAQQKADEAKAAEEKRLAKLTVMPELKAALAGYQFQQPGLQTLVRLLTEPQDQTSASKSTLNAAYKLMQLSRANNDDKNARLACDYAMLLALGAYNDARMDEMYPVDNDTIFLAYTDVDLDKYPVAKFKFPADGRTFKSYTDAKGQFTIEVQKENDDLAEHSMAYRTFQAPDYMYVCKVFNSARDQGILYGLIYMLRCAQGIEDANQGIDINSLTNEILTDDYYHSRTRPDSVNSFKIWNKEKGTVSSAAELSEFSETKIPYFWPIFKQ
ncbi:hypothetical protein AGMMS49957_16410 [Synergistales bacterium]|nr:hypothetical protein AGMMS49957_16410 [Synergistales bacterium]